jgi:hypothetical protein
MTERAKETWRDWMPPGSAEPTEDELITREQLLEQLHAAGVRISGRTLMAWEQAGIMPRPVRQRHTGATRAVYPQWVVDLGIAAQTFKAYGRPDKEIARDVRQWAKRSTLRNAVRRWDVMRADLGPILEEILHRYAAAAAPSRQPARVELKILDVTGEELDTYTFVNPKKPAVEPERF